VEVNSTEWAFPSSEHSLQAAFKRGEAEKVKNEEKGPLTSFLLIRRQHASMTN